MVDFTKLAVGIVMAIIGVIIAAEMLAGTFGTLQTSLTTLNNTAAIGTNATLHPIALRALIAPGGIIPLVLVAAFFLAIIVGLVALIKTPTR